MKIYLFNSKVFSRVQLVIILLSLLCLPFQAQSFSATNLIRRSISCAGLVCELLYCGEGKCKESNTSIFGADCECYPGWKKIQFGALIFPSCLIPNCTLDFHCGRGSPTPAPPSLPPPPPLSWFPNFSNPCNFVWCGDGNCRKNGNTYACECNAGSQNLLNSSRSACFKPCYLGADCSGPDIVFQGSSPPPLISPAPPPRRSVSRGHGFIDLCTMGILLHPLIIAWW